MPADKESTLTVRVAEAPGAKLPEVGETWAQARFKEALQLRFFDPAAAVLVKVMVLLAGAAWPSIAVKLKEVGLRPIVAGG
jgi:hypothetical protein